jgi:hypothetical protein
MEKHCWSTAVQTGETSIDLVLTGETSIDLVLVIKHIFRVINHGVSLESLTAVFL